MCAPSVSGSPSTRQWWSMPGSSWPCCSGSSSRSDGSPLPPSGDLPAAAPPWGKSSTKFKLSAQIQYCTNRSILIAPADPSSTALTDCRPYGEGNEADVRFGSLADTPTAIELQYGSIGIVRDISSGIENDLGTIGLQVFNGLGGQGQAALQN